MTRSPRPPGPVHAALRAAAALAVNRRGGGARILLSPGARLTWRILVEEGRGNRIVLEEGARVAGTIAIRGHDNLLHFGAHSRWSGRILMRGAGQRFAFGARSTCMGATALAQEDRDIEIGADCMLSRGIEIRTTDAHAVIARGSGARVNPPASVRIGDHVWIGLDALIGKGVEIAPDCIIAARSVVVRPCAERGVALGGVPARILRRGVTWSRDWKPRFDPGALWHPGGDG